MYAFAPAHVTGVFAVHDEGTEPLQRGSRGAGWSIERGAWAAATATDGPRRINLHLPGGEQASGAPVTAAALDALEITGGLDVDVYLELPPGQGFGMSAAGTLAAALAACHVAGLDDEDALAATHRAEVTRGTGLGDAVGSWFGGAELRLSPGCPPHGHVMRVEPDDADMLYCTLGDALPTHRVITDDRWKRRTRRWGDAAVDRVLEGGRGDAWHAIQRESAVFGKMLGLMPERMEQLGEQLPDDVLWGQVMLGSTMWVSGQSGDLQRAEAVLEGQGDLFYAKADPNGARLVRGIPAPLLEGAAAAADAAAAPAVDRTGAASR